MDEQYLLNRVREKGFNTLEEFIHANRHYLSKKEQEILYPTTGTSDPCHKKEYSTGDYRGKN